MHDRNISANTVASTTLWILGGLLILGDIFGLFGELPNGPAELGVYFAAGGGVLSIRGFFCCQARREQAAFELGQEAGRATLASTELRRI